jgi:two-component system sensor histidine kinase KdpD
MGRPGRALFQPTSRELKIHFANPMLAMVYLYRPHSRRKEPEFLHDEDFLCAAASLSTLGQCGERASCLREHRYVRSEMTSQREVKPLTDTDPSPALELFKAPFAVRYLAALVMTALATVVAIGIDRGVTIPNLSLVFVIPVIVAAVTFGLGSSLFSAILGALAYNFFLTEPRYTLNVDDAANIWAIALLFVVGCIASAVASTARHRADDVALLQRQTTALQLYGRDALAADNTRAIISNAASALEGLFQVPVVVMIMSEAGADFI